MISLLIFVAGFVIGWLSLTLCHDLEASRRAAGKLPILNMVCWVLACLKVAARQCWQAIRTLVKNLRNRPPPNAN